MCQLANLKTKNSGTRKKFGSAKNEEIKAFFDLFIYEN